MLYLLFAAIVLLLVESWGQGRVIASQGKQIDWQSKRIDALTEGLRIHGGGHSDHYANAAVLEQRRQHLEAQFAARAVSLELPPLQGKDRGAN